jgi:ferric-dicitrate binding protein FerR (iron transport regulator)
MSGITRLNTRAEIDEAAAVWAWRMDSASVSAADRRSFEAWLRKDPRHRRAYAELAEVRAGRVPPRQPGRLPRWAPTGCRATSNTRHWQPRSGSSAA